MKQNRTLYIACVFLCLLSPECYSREAMATTTSGIKDSGVFYSDDQIANAIFKAEGGYKAKYLYGIVSIPYSNEAEARRICLNTIRNNRKRFAKQTKYKDYLEFLASRYCPIGCDNDLGTNKYWLKNVKFFLERGC